ncbi:MAG: hypothetical protein HY912_16885 [Desulfomonile tiedjei]|uniref:Uncharacterized protein n=1 Tax=Desulfomonile tiedjei TaxID=2358 RepID=A0A9D6V311_9BACT|nr:hypothetical protein [Desulfomonile tiedjei]
MDTPKRQDPGCYTEHGVSGYGIAVKLSHPTATEEAEIKSMAEEMMLNIAEKCMARGARCIGHIKSHVRTDAGTLKADTIGVNHGAFSSGSLDHAVADLYMAVNSIVQGIHQEEVRHATLEGIHQVAEARGWSVQTEKEHAYFDEFDFTASKEDYKRQLEEQLAAMDQPEKPEEV